MKKFLLKVGLFFLALIIVDRALGMVFGYMGDHAKGGYIGHHKYVTDKVNEDILIFGSSRAIHHYNPQIITDSLGMTCYNCGQDGNGIVLFCGMWQMIKERYRPKMIIYDLTPEFDIYEGDANQRYLGWLRADYDRPRVKEIFSDIDHTEKYKMMSMLYRYNSKFMQNVTDYVHPIFKIEGNGFLPIPGSLDTLKIRQDNKSKNVVVDKQKLDYIAEFINDTKDIRKVFVFSPIWYGLDEETKIYVREICEEEKIPIVDFSNDSKYVHSNQFFSDGSHLNSRGADEFTKDLIKYIKGLQ